MKTNEYKKLNWATQILDRYVAGEFLFGYLVALGVVLGLRVMVDLFVQFDEFVEAKDNIRPGLIQVVGYIAGYYGPKIFEYFRDFSGMIIMLAASFSLARMTRQNELTAILASGISLKRIVAPIVLMGFVLNLLMVADQELILPGLADKLTRSHDEVAERNVIKDIFVRDGRDNLLFAGRFDPDRLALRNVLIVLRRQGNMIGRITADEATWNAANKSWQLSAGLFYNDDFQQGGTGLAAPIESYPSELTPDYIWLQRHSNFKSLMSSHDLKQLVRKRQLKQIEQLEAIGETHFRLADPIINMVMLLLSLPMLVSRERRSTPTALGLAIAGAGGCFVVTFICKLLAGMAIPPFLAAMIPIVVFTPLAILTLDSIKT